MVFDGGSAFTACAILSVSQELYQSKPQNKPVLTAYLDNSEEIADGGWDRVLARLPVRVPCGRAHVSYGWCGEKLHPRVLHVEHDLVYVRTVGPVRYELHLRIHWKEPHRTCKYDINNCSENTNRVVAISVAIELLGRSTVDSSLNASGSAENMAKRYLRAVRKGGTWGLWGFLPSL